MSGLFVDFMIGEDIVTKLKSLQKNKRMDFILGLSDDDYFGKHFLSVEELDSQYENLLCYFANEKESKVKFFRGSEFLTDCANDNTLLLEKYESAQNFINVYGSLTPMKLASLYSKLIRMKIINEHELNFINFIYFYENLKDICQEAVNVKGSLLFCFEHPVDDLMKTFSGA